MSDQTLDSKIEEAPGTLQPGEIHPMSHSAFDFVKDIIVNEGEEIFKLVESLASCAIEGNRLAEVCGETLRRILHGEAVSDRYLLGLAWFLATREDYLHVAR